MPVEGVEGAEVGRNGVVFIEAVQHQPQVTPCSGIGRCIIPRWVALTCLSLAFSRARTVCRRISSRPCRVRPKMWVKPRNAKVSGLP
jgi:hypothetical protein